MSIAAVQAQSLRLIGRATLPHGMAVGKTQLGGLSGVSWDSATKTFWAISDDSSYKGGPPRAYQLSVRLDGGADLEPRVLGTLTLRDENGRPFPVADCEGIACTGRSAVWVSSEGRAGKNGALPWVRLFSLSSGKALRSLTLPDVFLPKNVAGKNVPINDPTEVSGIVGNKSLESCSVTPDLGTVYTANETSLVQEKMPGENKGGAGIFNRTQVRIAAFDARTGRCLSQKIYVSDAGCLFGSISDLAATDNRGGLLVLERRVVRLQEGPGACGIRIYRVNFSDPAATDVRSFASVTEQKIVPLRKTLVYDSQATGLERADNLEGMAVVPLPNGLTGLLMVSDDNFKTSQETQIMLFRLVE